MESSLFGQGFQQGIPLSQFTAAITDTVASARGLSGVWVVAELSDVRMVGGHCYMELIEKNEAGQTVAKLRATIWRSTFNLLRQKFFQATQREISNGIKALVRGSATHHSLYGLAFNIIDIDPSYSLGDMERLRREIIMRLQKEGISTRNKSVPMPMAPQRIAVISAEGAAGYGDFMNQLLGNREGFVFYPCLFPCVMQGDKVSESIRAALELIEASADIWDCIAIVRGGGATTDLNGFDDYELARAVATCGLPIVVGIGHERDRNVLDEIANTSLKTPTAVAGFFIDKSREAFERVTALADRLRVYSTELLRGEERRLSTLQGFLPQLLYRKLDEAGNRLHALSGKLPLMTKGRVDKENVKLDGLKGLLQHSATGKIVNERLKVENIRNILPNLATAKIERGKRDVTSLESLVTVLNPQNTLKRGYSITRYNGKAVKNMVEIPSGAILVTTLAEGEIRSMSMLEEEK